MASRHDSNQNPDVGPALLWAAVLNTGYVFIEALFGFWVGSLALLADAAHNLTDVFGLLIAWGAFVVARRRPTERHTYGLGRATVLAALANGIALLIGVGALVVSALVIISTGWTVVDPIVAILVSAMIAWSAFRLFKTALHLSLDGIPEGVDLSAIRAWLRALPGVVDLHDLHIWALSSTSNALTVHLVMPDGCPGDAFLEQTGRNLETSFNIAHATVQVERGAETECNLANPARP